MSKIKVKTQEESKRLRFIEQRKKRIEEQKEEEGKRRRSIYPIEQRRRYVLRQKPSFLISSNMIVEYIQTLKDLLELLRCPREIEADPEKKIALAQVTRPKDRSPNQSIENLYRGFIEQVYRKAAAPFTTVATFNIY